MSFGMFFAEMQIKDAYEKIAQCKSELTAAKCIRRNRQGSVQSFVSILLSNELQRKVE